MDRKIRCLAWHCGLISLLLAICGCAPRYHAPPFSEKQTARLEAVVPVWLVSLDDKRVSSFSPFGHKRLTVTAEAHVVEVQFYDNSTFVGGTITASTNNIRIRFVAQAGQHYYINAGRIGNRWQPYITDTREAVFSDPKLN